MDLFPYETKEEFPKFCLEEDFKKTQPQFYVSLVCDVYMRDMVFHY